MNNKTIQFISKAKEKFPNLDYSKTEYINSEIPMTFICPKHGEFKRTKSSFMSAKHQCPKCGLEARADQRRMNIQTFINRSKKIHGNKYDYSKVKYKNNDSKITIICPEHGEFEQRPSVHLQGGGCPKCGHELAIKRDNEKRKESLRAINENNLKERKNNFISKSIKIHNGKYDYSKVKYINNIDKVTIICPEHGEFEQSPMNHLQGNGCPKCGNIGPSIPEIEIVKFIKDHYSGKIFQSDRNLISPYELDIVIPEYRLAIEYNGLLWHSFGKIYPDNYDELDKNYHLTKTQLCEEQGYQLFHIFENEWIDSVKREIWKSMILNRLNLIPSDNTIYARKCQIRQVSNDEAIDFLNLNHLQGAGRIGSIRLGLYHNDELLSLMTFGKPSISKSKTEYELIRFCSKINFRVVGAASKLLKYFERNFKPKSIISYANRRWSNGSLYNSLKFQLVKISNPNYFYFQLNDFTKLYSRNAFQKHMLKTKLENFNNSLSEVENMIDNGYRIIYDCGNYVYLKM